MTTNITMRDDPPVCPECAKLKADLAASRAALLDAKQVIEKYELWAMAEAGIEAGFPENSTDLAAIARIESALSVVDRKDAP